MQLQLSQNDIEALEHVVIAFTLSLPNVGLAMPLALMLSG